MAEGVLVQCKPFVHGPVYKAVTKRNLRGNFPFLGFGAVQLSPHERDKLLVSVAGMVASDRRRRGIKLNYPEAAALITCFVLEGAREGRTVAELMSAGRGVVGRHEVMDGVAELLDEVQVEATFPDGTKLVTVHDPIP
jgi:urease subunit gamma